MAAFFQRTEISEPEIHRLLYFEDERRRNEDPGDMRLNRAHFPWPVWVGSGHLEETDQFLRLSIFRGRRFFSNSPGNIHGQSEKLRLGWFAFLKWREQI